ncbi:TraM recognition domain-containing protein [Rhodococcus hoagii]|nr:TraM recognition domain-containing protein [Prescottella equi]
MIAMFGQFAEAKAEVQRTLVLVDEFSALESSLTTELLARGRSAGADVILSTQTIEDLELAADAKAAIGQTLGNVNVIIAHAIRYEASAQAVASTAGTRTWVKRRMGSEANQSVLAVNKGAATGADLIEETPTTPL